MMAPQNITHTTQQNTTTKAHNTALTTAVPATIALASLFGTYKLFPWVQREIAKLGYQNEEHEEVNTLQEAPESPIRKEIVEMETPKTAFVKSQSPQSLEIPVTPTRPSPERRVSIRHISPDADLEAAPEEAVQGTAEAMEEDQAIVTREEIPKIEELTEYDAPASKLEETVPEESITDVMDMIEANHCTHLDNSDDNISLLRDSGMTVLVRSPRATEVGAL